MQDSAKEGAGARDPAAHDRVAAPGQLARVREPLRERHRDAGTERCGEPCDEGVMRSVRDDRDGKDRRECRQRAVDQSDHRRLHTLQKECVTVGHRLEYIKQVAKW